MLKKHKVLNVKKRDILKTKYLVANVFDLCTDHLVATGRLKTSLSSPSSTPSCGVSSPRFEVSTHQKIECYFVAPVLPSAIEIVLTQAL